jgi:hypothetical protein
MTTELDVTDDNWRDMRDSDVAGALSSVIQGHDSVAAENLIRYFHFAFKSGDLLANCAMRGSKERMLIEYLEYAFDRYVEVKSIKSLDAAFGLKKAIGQRDVPDHSMRNLGIAAFVVLKMRSGSNWDVAVGDAANTFFPDGKGQRACEDAYAKHNNALQCFPNDLLEALSDQI